MFEYAGNIPEEKSDIYPIEKIALSLKPLIGRTFSLTGKQRTDGSNMRKLVAHQLNLCFDKSLRNKSGSYIVDKKGTPKITSQLLISYLATPPYDSQSYNLQVWNYNPSIPNNPLVFQKDGEVLFTYNDIRIAIIWVNRDTHIIESITLATPPEITEIFGSFGKPTVKHQMIINDNIRREIYASKSKLKIGTEFFNKQNDKTQIVQKISTCSDNELFKRTPSNDMLYSIKDLGTILSNALLGQKIDETATKITGQSLEYLTLTSLGYRVQIGTNLEGMFPDIRHQLLEVKVQKRQTVDLGEFSPLEKSLRDISYSADMVRYLFALVNDNDIIDGLILMYGKELPQYYHFVPEKSYKCQRSIPENELYTKNKGAVSLIQNGKITKI